MSDATCFSRVSDATLVGEGVRRDRQVLFSPLTPLVQATEASICEAIGLWDLSASRCWSVVGGRAACDGE